MTETKHITVDAHSLLITKIDNEWTTTSLEISKCFEREHKTIMSKFRRDHLTQYDEFRAEHQLVLGSYLDANNQSRPMWLLKERAFLFIIVNLTGKVASIYKAQIIEEFLAMRDALTQAQMDALELKLAKATRPEPSAGALAITEAVANSALDNNGTMRLGAFANLLSGKYTDQHISVQTLYIDLKDMGLVYKHVNTATVVARDLLWSTADTSPYDCVRVIVSNMDTLIDKLADYWAKGNARPIWGNYYWIDTNVVIAGVTYALIPIEGDEFVWGDYVLHESVMCRLEIL